MTGGEAIARMLKNEGVTKVFGIIDGTYFGLYSNLSKYGIELITPRHETSGVHMAGAYARVTGMLGVCLASNGPGAANALPGVAVENAEGNRVLLITISCSTTGNDEFLNLAFNTGFKKIFRSQNIHRILEFPVTLFPGRYD